MPTTLLESFREYRFGPLISSLAPPDLKLTEAEIGILAETVYTYLQASGELKADAATIERKSDGTVIVKVPARSADAQILWESLSDQIDARFDKNRGSQIRSAIGSNLVAFCCGFGASNEEFTLSQIEGDSRNYSFSRTVFPPDPTDTVATRLCGSYAGSFMDNKTTVPELGEAPDLAFLVKLISGKDNGVRGGSMK